MPALSTARAKSIFSKYGVLSERELAARVEIAWERYVKVGNIEASAALDIARTMILPAAVRYLSTLAGASGSSRAVAALTNTVGGQIDELSDAIDALEHAVHTAHAAHDVHDEARAFVNDVIPAQAKLREIADELETIVADDLWPLPKYRELLFQY